MIITHFGGDIVAFAYALSQVDSEEDYSIDRPPVVAQVSGASGAFNFYGQGTGDDKFALSGVSGSPAAPRTITKTFKLHEPGGTYTDVKDLLDELVRNTVAFYIPNGPHPIIHATRRDGTRIKALGECTSVSPPERIGQFQTLAVDLSFFLSEGLWYSEGRNQVVRNGAGVIAIANAGNWPAMVRVQIEAGVIAPEVKVKRTSTPTGTICQWEWVGTTSGAGSNRFRVDPDFYSVTNGGVGAYADFTAGAGQVAWLWLPPTNTADGGGGPDTYELEIAASVMASQTTTVSWHDTYLL